MLWVPKKNHPNEHVPELTILGKVGERGGGASQCAHIQEVMSECQVILHDQAVTLMVSMV